MYTPEDLEEAVDRGIFTRDAVTQFQAHVVARGLPGHKVDEEQFRLISGFNDIFVVIACVLMLVSTLWIGISLAPKSALLATGLVAWGQAECFVRRRRMALPAIVLLLAFTASMAGLAFVLAALDEGFSGVFVVLGAAALAAWVHWLRFRVPMAVALCAGAVLCATGLFVMSLLAGADAIRIQDMGTFGNMVFFACGVAAFMMAMRWDMQDPARISDKSDIAFWLHMLAAPLLVHPVFSNMALTAADGVGPLQALSVVLLYGVIGIVSLAIDRRALMVAALSYVLAVFANLLLRYGVVNMNFAVTALVVGTALLLLSVFWHRMRARVMAVLPGGIVRRLPRLR